MTESHYAHLAPNYVAETLRAALPALGIAEDSNVAALLYPQPARTEATTLSDYVHESEAYLKGYRAKSQTLRAVA